MREGKEKTTITTTEEDPKLVIQLIILLLFNIYTRKKERKWLWNFSAIFFDFEDYLIW